MSGHDSRRGFLRGLTTLPLIGGSVALIGRPSAVAVPVTPGMIATYIAWLDAERRYVQWGTNSRGFISQLNPGACFHGRHADIRTDARQAIERAPIILSAVGCMLTCREAEEMHPHLQVKNWREGVRCA